MQNNQIQRTNLTRKEAAMTMGVSLATLDTFIHRAVDPLPIFRIGTRKVLIPINAMEAWLKRETERCTGA